jgi:hypothetical protein
MSSSASEFDNNAERERFFRLLWTLCRRPGMFTLSGSPEEIWAFIHGADSLFFGLAGATEPSPLDRFAAWLANELACEATQSELWFLLIQHHWARFAGLDKEAIWSLLARYYKNRFGEEFRPLQIASCEYSDASEPPA